MLVLWQGVNDQGEVNPVALPTRGVPGDLSNNGDVNESKL